jgi:hypothetical protein
MGASGIGLLAFIAKNAPIAPPIRRRAIATVAIKRIGFLG